MCAQLTFADCNCSWMPTMFEHWTQIRTPEQFAIYYDCIKEVAAEAKAGLVPMKNVAGFDGFNQLYRVPIIECEVDGLSIRLSGEASDLYGLAAFLDDADGLAFTRVEAGFQKSTFDEDELKATIEDLEELTELWGWQLNK